MSDPTTAPVQPEGTPSAVQQAPAGFVEQARYTGAVQKIEQLVAQVRTLEAQLAAKTSEIEQLGAQLSVKDVEKTVAINERDQRLQEVVTAKSAADQELTELRALKLKIDAINELKRPELLQVVHTLPAMTDPAALKMVLTDLASFADSAVRVREQQLMAGVMPGVSGVGAQAAATPQSQAEWQKHINTLPLGSPERAKAMDQYGDWIETQHRPK